MTEVIQIDDISRSTETELIRDAANGNSIAFRNLYDSNISRIYALCLRLTASVDEADDLTQEVFIKAWRKLSDFKFESKFSTWLHRIAVNEFLTGKRSEKRNLQKLMLAKEDWEVTMTQYYSFSNERDISMDLEKAMSKLPGQQKIAFILHDIEGYQHNEIAEMLDISEGTSKSNLHRARKLLRGLLKQESMVKK